MITMNEPQVWVLIAAFVAMMGTMITVVMTSFVRSMNAGFERLETKFDAKLGALETKVDARFEAFEARMDVRFGQIDADITALTRRVMGDAG
ncbi:hypothetical protein [Microbacterium marinilacus]|nr:hypothetical protein [Microbacterium marinilacus]